jgi:hypothetical protein
VLTGLGRLREGGIEPGVIAVCDPAADPVRLGTYPIDTLGVTEFDVLIPDATHEDAPPSIAAFYRTLFDHWLDHWPANGVRIRIVESLVAGLAGHEANSECLGYGPNLHFSLMPDGGLEALDTLRMIGKGQTRSAYNILRDDVQDLQNDPFWQEALEAPVRLPSASAGCTYRFACGGAHLGRHVSGFVLPLLTVLDEARFIHVAPRSETPSGTSVRRMRVAEDAASGAPVLEVDDSGGIEVIATDDLAAVTGRLGEGPLLLDIDLDYFDDLPGEKTVVPDDRLRETVLETRARLRALLAARTPEVVTVATSPEFFPARLAAASLDWLLDDRPASGDDGLR